MDISKYLACPWLLALIVRHNAHRIKEMESDPHHRGIETPEDEAAAYAVSRSIDGRDILSWILNCPQCQRFIEGTADKLEEELETLTDHDLSVMFLSAALD